MPDLHLLLQDRVKGHFNGFPTPAMGLELLQEPTRVLRAMSYNNESVHDERLLHDSVLQPDSQTTGCEHKLGYETSVSCVC